jgi:radical SAM superfamily enzyme YgiQ (UPF0313 family)
VAAVLLLGTYELGHAPLTLAWPLAFLRRAGREAEAVDLAVDTFDEARVREASLVAVSVPMHTALRLGLEAAARVRRANPRAHVCFYGPYAWLNAAHLLAGPADSVVAGEAEEALVALADDVARGGDGSRVRGVSTRGRRAPALRDRLHFPVPDRATLPPLSRYARFLRDGRAEPAGYVEASRGCRHLCRHCPLVPIYQGRFVAVPVPTVMADVRAQVEAGARHVTFGDPDFLNGPTHALRVARALAGEFPGLSFDFTAKVEHLLRHRALLPEMAAHGCAFVVSAVESLSDEVLRRLDKGHTAAEVAAVVEVLDAAGIALQPTLVAFTPWTTLDDYLATLDFFRARGLQAHVPPVQLAIRLLVPPGSALLEAPETRGAFGPLDPRSLSHVWRHPDPRMDRLYEEVAALVEEATEAGRPAAETWERVRAAAHASAGVAPVPDAGARPARPAPPRLSEDWFCCAEPRRVQVERLALSRA